MRIFFASLIRMEMLLVILGYINEMLLKINLA